jgi:CRISPR/Cas system-associated exonuclease Cas4 (RecB family)
MMKDESASAEIVEFAELRAKCYAFKVERSDNELKKMNTDASSFASAETSYTRPMYSEHSPQGRKLGLTTSLTEYIGDALRNFVKDNRSGVVCKEIKKGKESRKEYYQRR